MESASEPLGSSSRLVIARGARAAEGRLVDEVLAAHEERLAAFRAGRGDALARPLRIVVPSRSLREHLSAALVRRAGRSLAGVLVQTQRALAHAVLERAGEAPPAGDALLPVLVRRCACDEGALEPLVEQLDEGLRIVEAAVRDLLDAGFSASSYEAALDALADAPEVGPVAQERARAVVRVALGTLRGLDALGLGHRSSLLARAREIVAECGSDALPTAALWVHGFADATGLVAEWIEALVRSFAGCVVVDAPPDPAVAERFEDEFPRPFVERMDLLAAREEVAAPDPGPSLELLRAPGTTSEVRAVAARVRALLDQHARPESIGIVARRLEPYRAALDAQLGRLAIPFSVIGARAGADAGSRRAAALVRLLADCERASTDCWLSADAGTVSGAREDGDLRVALHALGAGRLRDVVALDLASAFSGSSLALPVRRGLLEEDGASDAKEEGSRATRRVNRRRAIERRALEAAQARARRVVARLDGWPARAPVGEHLRVFASLLEEDLGLRRDAEACVRVLDATHQLRAGLPEALPLDRDEMALLLERALQASAEPSLGGAGAGVRVLSATHARGCTFEHLFVLGMNRNGFPRGVVEDALVPDVLRRRLRDVLPEMPIKERARDEERHLFAELVSSSPRVALAWQHVSDEGRERPESPYIVRLGLLRSDLPRVTAPMLFEAPSEDPVWGEAPRPAHEHAALAGLAGARSSLELPRELALREVRSELPAAPDPPEPEAIARFHLSVLDELDPRRSDAPRLGPWFGFAGNPIDGDAVLSATRLQDLARCGWQAFLRRELGLEPVPDALDALPAPDALARGRVAHLALERIARAVFGEAAPTTLAEAVARGPIRVPWPDDAELAALLRDAAREVARDDGVWLPGFAAALARNVAPWLDAARAVDWRDPEGLAVLGVEVTGEVLLRDGADRERRLHFRADRADLDARGVLRLTDYKTGAPISRAVRLEKRAEAFEKKVASGSFLQAPMYWLAASELAPIAEGRFLFLGDGLADDARVLRVGASEGGIAASFEAAARVVLEAWDRGALGPRLAGRSGDEPSACRWCEVSAACLRGESVHRARLRDWERAAAAGEIPLATPAERALLALQRIGDEEGSP